MALSPFESGRALALAGAGGEHPPRLHLLPAWLVEKGIFLLEEGDILQQTQCPTTVYIYIDMQI